MARKTRGEPSRKGAQRAIARGKKPVPTISDRAGLAARAQAKRQSCRRIRKLPNLPDVIDKIKEGYGDKDVARFIHQEGHLQDVPIDLIRKEVTVYRTKHMKPAEVAEQRLSKGVVEAERQVRRGLDELTKAADLYSQQEQVLAGAVAGYSNIVGAMQAAAESTREAIEEGGMTSKDSQAALTQLSKLSAAVVKDAGTVSKAFDGARKTLKTSAEIRALLGLEDRTDHSTPDMIERRVTEYTERVFPGRKDAREVLQNAESRARLVTLFQKVTTDKTLHKDLEALDVQAEPVDPEAN